MSKIAGVGAGIGIGTFKDSGVGVRVGPFKMSGVGIGVRVGRKIYRLHSSGDHIGAADHSMSKKGRWGKKTSESSSSSDSESDPVELLGKQADLEIQTVNSEEINRKKFKRVLKEFDKEQKTIARKERKEEKALRKKEKALRKKQKRKEKKERKLIESNSKKERKEQRRIVNDFLRTQDKEDKMQMKLEREKEIKERREAGNSNGVSVRKVWRAPQKWFPGTVKLEDQFDKIERQHRKERKEKREKERQERKKKEKLEEDLRAIALSLREVDRRARGISSRFLRGQSSSIRHDSPNRYQREENMTEECFEPSIRLAWEGNYYPETPSNSNVTHTLVQPLKVFEHTGFEERLTSTIETGVRVIIEKQRLLGKSKGSEEEKKKFKEFFAFGEPIRKALGYYPAEYFQKRVNVPIPQNVLKASEKVKLHRFLKAADRSKVRELKGLNVLWDYIMCFHPGIPGAACKHVPRLDLKAALENIDFSIQEYAVVTAGKMMEVLDRADEV